MQVKRLFTCKTRDDVDSLLKSGCSVNRRRGVRKTICVYYSNNNMYQEICLGLRLVVCVCVCYVFTRGLDESEY